MIVNIQSQYSDIPNEAKTSFGTSITSNSLTITDQISSASGYTDAPPAADDDIWRYCVGCFICFIFIYKFVSDFGSEKSNTTLYSGVSISDDIGKFVTCNLVQKHFQKC
jgi:hypothetical protein